MLDSVFYDYGSASSSSSCRVVSVVVCVVGNSQITFLCEVGFRKEHDVNVANSMK
jgi:hypothetical protein